MSELKSWLHYLTSLEFPVANLIAGLLIGLLINWVVYISLAITSKKARSNDLLILRKHCKGAFNFFVPVLFIFIALHYADDNSFKDLLMVLLRILLVVATTHLLIRFVYSLEAIFLERYQIDKEDNRRERKIITQLNFVKKTFIIVLVMIGLAVILLSFEAGRKYGQTILTSAGVASVIIGFAAQKSIANFLAGIQIAFTQPIKIDDAVLVEGEWGWIEEINLTYVVVRLWDWRRLVLPITYFIEKPFQNWTRNKGEIIGSVMLHLDYRTPVPVLREQLTTILNNEPLWDGKVNSLQVVDTREHYIMVRALMSAKNSPMAWDLRCSVREQLISYLQKHHPESLPIQRMDIQRTFHDESHTE
ncbi:mechanosensitive ion channel family protein [Marinoscillum furvescens]|uniref:Mechanosensitive ion channel-like protein n=1 Tax=Marinoscillum furvescens DSM 4134 TaxID=1122208 RepID=A0A3D9L359_MARFU|nr:mechanosensitive ion channel domain-containing protein [Marinoscillum furvescens]RED98812.1 mechanosensitive ion channel-like protein [Marinoscillum furvescens DSM 4134]